jgi:hexosaminidase
MERLPFLTWLSGGLWLALAVVPFARAAESATEPALLPRPQSLELRRGEFERPAILLLGMRSDDAGVRALADQLVQRLDRACGLRARVGGPKNSEAHLWLRLDGDAPAAAESYRLAVTRRRIELRARELAGLRHATTTALQLLCAGPRIPALRIEDAPRFAWRGLMLDSARHYQSPDYLRRLLDAMSWHKLNVLHWHLTDDQAWRLQIRKYPRLTEVGAWRVPAGAARRDIDPATGAPRRHGGFYDQATVRALVEYAAARGIAIVPEIEMPGHASAAIAAYPWLAAEPGAVRDVPSDWGIYPNAFALEERSYAFLEDVLAETLELFPSSWIHVGGDEVEPGQWQRSAAGKALAATLPEGRTLQGSFTARMARWLEARGRRLVGWDEILVPDLAPRAVVMSWRGSDGAIEAARRGHDTVLSAWPTLYFDNRQAAGAEEPPGRVRTIGLREVYAFDPLPEALDAAARRHVLGLQGNVWTEHIRTEARADHMAFPRAAAIAELGWSDASRRDWPGFAGRLARLWPHYAALGVAAADAAFAPVATVDYAPDRRRAEVALATPEAIGEIRYTLDGSRPEPSSARWPGGRMALDLPARLRAATFLDGRALSRPRDVALAAELAQQRGSRELALCSDGIALMLEDDAPPEGERTVFSADIQAPCWRFERAALDRVVALEARVGQVPFNFQIGAAREAIRFPAPRQPAGELLVYLGARCEGEPQLRLDLAPAIDSDGVTTLPRVAWQPPAGTHDLCLRFAQVQLEPLWLLDSVRLVEE